MTFCIWLMQWYCEYGIRNPGIHSRNFISANQYTTKWVCNNVCHCAGNKSCTISGPTVKMGQLHPTFPPQISDSRRRRAHTTHDVSVSFPCLHPRANMMSYDMFVSGMNCSRLLRMRSTVRSFVRVQVRSSMYSRVYMLWFIANTILPTS